MATYIYDLPLDSELEPCPMACGRMTEDPYGGPCQACWDALPRPGDDGQDWDDG